jgi:hypothetical protein
LRYTRISLALAGLVALGLVALPAPEAKAGAIMHYGTGVALTHALWSPVAVWKDCQEIALCTGCKPVYKCRSCTYQRTCAGGLCRWGDVCVWGPAVKVLPRGARIIRQ